MKKNQQSTTNARRWLAKNKAKNKTKVGCSLGSYATHGEAPTGKRA